jgi:hypothetical protein
MNPPRSTGKYSERNSSAANQWALDRKVSSSRSSQHVRNAAGANHNRSPFLANDTFSLSAFEV